MISNIYPKPRKWIRGQNEFPRPASILVKSVGAAFKSTENTLAFANKLIGEEKPTLLSSGACNYTLEVASNKELGPQAYNIEIKENGGIIASSSETGLFYALVSFAQLYKNTADSLQSHLIEDSPDLLDRGFMLDISRCKIPKLETLFTLVDQLAQLKYNQLQLYMEHTFAYQGHETVWRDASPYTADDIKRIDKYCADRFIELVPNQNSFGHFERWLKHPEYHSLAECPNGYTHPISGPLDHGGTLKPNNETLLFLESLHDQLLPNFSSRRFNIGCDETWELGQGWSRSAVEKSSKRAVYLKRLQAIAESVANRGIHPQFWGDVILEQPELVKELPNNLCALIWGYESDHPFEEQLAAFRAADIAFLVAPGTSSWNSIGGRWNNAENNIKRAISSALRNDASGMLLTDWGDRGHHQPYAVSLPSITLAAGRAWCEESNDTNDTIQQTVFMFLDTRLNENLGALFETLGNVYTQAGPPTHNASLLNIVLFAKNDQIGKVAPNLSKSGLEKISSTLRDLGEPTQTPDTPNSFTNQTREQLQLATEMLLFASDKGLKFLNGKTDNHWESTRLNSILGEFQRQWKRDNREGGLAESSKRLLQSIDS